ncbi:hypothetical protein G5B37_04615 [Rasiella rasia]|uniref:Histidine kinase domain-containing protein n=1 Tax=Rasiella rasia TaxID=2744027 RepID=A0A6G6GJZ5_9FLAO|nr:sensor histidine kinase [Rasiella rasia]QIE58868.1 hypothetical protein G5B37_04615 [Rasiella rasia]
MKKPIIFILLLLFIFEIYAQNQIQFQHYGVDDGLSQIAVYDLEIDKTGHVWVATHKGVNRFNGSKFDVFQTPIDTLKNGLVFNEVFHTIEDTDGMIWLGTRKGLSKYNPRTQLFTNFSKVGTCDQCLIRDHIAFLKEHGPYIYIGTSGGLSRINKETHNITSWPYVEGKKDGPRKTAIREIEVLDDGRLVLVSNVGISIFNPENDTFKHLDSTNGLPEDKLQSIFRDSKNRYWIGCETLGLVLLTGTWDNPSFKHYPPQPNKGPSHGFIYEISEDKNGLLWMATFHGITLLQPETETFTYLYHNPNNDNSLSSNQVFSIARDANDRMWVATISGLDVYDPYLNQFGVLRYEKDNPRSLASDKTFSIYEDSKGFLWIGNYENGVTVISPDNSVEAYIHISNGEGEQKLSGAQIIGIEEDDHGRIWLATFNGVNIIDWADRTKKTYTISQFDLSTVTHNAHLSQYTYFIKKGKNGSMYVGTHGAGLIKVNRDGSLKQFSFKDKPTGILENVIISMEIDEKDRIWLGTSILGFGMIEDENTQDYFTRLPGNAIMGSYGIHKILCVDERELIMTTGAGVFQFSDKEALFTSSTPQVKRFTEEDGLSDNVVYEMVKVNQNQYWLSTGNGLTKWNKATNELKPYIKTLANKNLDFNQAAAVKTKDGKLYFGNTSGVIHFNPNKIFENTAAPKVYYSNLRVLNEIVPIKGKTKDTFTIPEALRYLQKITLKPQDKIFSIQVTTVNHTLPKQTSFAYKLDGFEENWTYTTNPIITRTNLDPGTYTLLAKASNNDGVWSAPISLQIEILPPWHRTWWAYILFALAAIGFVYFLLKLRLQQERRVELARAQERDIFRKRSSRDFHDEAGTKITRISLITELARMENIDNKALQDHLHQIEENVQDLNSGMRDFIWTLDPSKDNAYDTLTRYTEFAGKFCEYANIQFKSEPISEDLKTKELNMAERRHLLMILKEATNNCVKHGNPTTLHFSIQHKPGKLIVILKDNGNGFDTNQESNGNGLKNMRERAEALGGALKINSKTNGGTALTLTLETTRLGN